MALLDEALAELPTRSKVLDAGCGAGLPIAAHLAGRFEVLGIDISPVQIEMARTNVPAADFALGDIADIDLPDASFDAVVCLYALFHLPRAEHAGTLRGFRRLLRPAGTLLLSLGFSDSEVAIDPDWLAAGQPMYWSHFDHQTSTTLVREAGFEIAWERLVIESEEFGGARHPFILAHRM